MTTNNKLSIVIPAGPGENAWHQLLKDLEIFGKDVEIIISACQEQAVDIDLPVNVQWIQTTQGRARQLNAGARMARGECLWFLHADTRLTMGVIDAVQQMLESEVQNMGYFRLKFADDGPRQTQVNAWAANIRSHFFGLPFGDQGFIMSKTVFEQLNGFDETISLGEDLDFVVRLRAAGIPLQKLPAELLSSSRRYQQQGWLSTSIRHIYLTFHLTRQAKRRLEFGR